MYRAIFIDIDGTLITSDHRITTDTFNVIGKLKEKNTHIVLVSARPLHGILAIAKETGLLDSPIVSLNGAYIADNGKILFDSVIEIKKVVKVHEQLQKFDATPIYYEQNKWFSDFRNSATDHEQRITSIPIQIQPFIETVQHWQHNNTGPNKILVIAQEKVIDEIQNNLKQEFLNDLNIYNSKPTFLEIMNTKSSKVDALKLLISLYNIQQKETIAIGDNFNDKQMIEFAGLGIAMGNAPDEVKAIADYVTDSNNNDGVSKALRTILNL